MRSLYIRWLNYCEILGVLEGFFVLVGRLGGRVFFFDLFCVIVRCVGYEGW